MLQSPRFIKLLLRNPLFTRRVLSMVVDEAHCISHWGANFRKKYQSIAVARAFLSRGTPVLALSATLTRRVRRDIQTKLQFPRSGSQYWNNGNDRSNISIVVRACQNPMNSFADLNFVIPEHVSKPEDIPKTWIYIDDINTGNDMVNYLGNLLEERGAGGGGRIAVLCDRSTQPCLKSTVVRQWRCSEMVGSGLWFVQMLRAW